MMLFSYPIPFLFKKWCVVLGEPKQDFPYTSISQTQMEMQDLSLLSAWSKQSLDTSLPRSNRVTKQIPQRSVTPTAAALALWLPQHSMLPASGSLCGCEGKTAAVALLPAVPVSLWSSGSQIWRQQALHFSSELKNTEQAFAVHRRIRVGGLAPSTALDKQEEVTGHQLRYQKTTNAGESGWGRQSWEDNTCCLVLHSRAFHWTSAEFWLSVCLALTQWAPIHLWLHCHLPLRKQHVYEPLSSHNMCTVAYQ